jgi:hypothetical protein
LKGIVLSSRLYSSGISLSNSFAFFLKAISIRGWLFYF